jgi:predicted nucleotidyltransferase
MDQDDAASISKWVADMNLNMSKSNSDPQMELVWFPITLDENGQGEPIGEGDSAFNLQQLKSPGNVFQTGHAPVTGLDIINHSQSSPSLQLLLERRNRKLRVDEKLSGPLGPPEKDENNNDVWLHIEDGDPKEASPDTRRPSEYHRLDVEDPNEHAVEIEPIDEVGVEVQPDDQNNRRAVRHNWRMLLFLLIIFILCYQLIDRYFITGSTTKGLLSGGGGGGT